MSDDSTTIDFSIRIVNEDGEGIEGLTVRVTYLISTESKETDDGGWAHFSHVTMADKMMQGGTRASEVNVKGSVVAEDLWIEDGDTFSFTYSEE